MAGNKSKSVAEGDQCFALLSRFADNGKCAGWIVLCDLNPDRLKIPFGLRRQDEGHAAASAKPRYFASS
ncbi:MAG: hypothetical protein B7Y98_13115 [Sphingomonas sp. 32-62-10]|nr:MAG: hypothetical protein B7Z43_10540 [Sphingomonas sp. 12-62-6]OYX37230.1 MAG: hypothetical protein B7Y98_13115 [Sphingomonas sp. 32-62-10]